MPVMLAKLLCDDELFICGFGGCLNAAGCFDGLFSDVCSVAVRLHVVGHFDAVHRLADVFVGVRADRFAISVEHVRV